MNEDTIEGVLETLFEGRLENLLDKNGKELDDYKEEHFQTIEEYSVSRNQIKNSYRTLENLGFSKSHIALNLDLLAIKHDTLYERYKYLTSNELRPENDGYNEARYMKVPVEPIENTLDDIDDIPVSNRGAVKSAYDLYVSDENGVPEGFISDEQKREKEILDREAEMLLLS